MPGAFGNMGGPGMGMAGMNGMNMNMGMGMNLGPNQGYGGWNNGPNMWSGPQNNNPNAFPNAMGGDFGPNAGFGFNMSQQGNFHQQQYPNADFQPGFRGRGAFRARGRGRGAFRGRGGFTNNFQGNMPYAQQQPYDQQQLQYQQFQGREEQEQAPKNNDPPVTPSDEGQSKTFQSDLAPGGHDEAEEAIEEPSRPDQSEASNIDTPVDQEAEKSGGIGKTEDSVPENNDLPTKDEPLEGESKLEPVDSITKPLPQTETPLVQEDAPETFKEDLGVQQSMPPPSAPLGPSARLDNRGSGRTVRGRGSVHLPNGIQPPSRPTSDVPFRSPVESKGQGIVGAPTGPKAMRSGPPTGPRGRGGGFQIVGRAAMMNQGNRPVPASSDRRYEQPQIS